MVHNEMSFLFGDINQSNLDVIRNNNDGNAGDVFGVIDTSKYARVYKDTTHNNNVWGYLNDVVYPTKSLNQDPYMALLEYFSGIKTPSMGLKPADFVYLKDLGVYPINRLIILRRFRDGCIVPNNLTLFKEKPIATVVGWVKMDDQNKDLFSISFNEKWVETSDTLDKVIQKIMKEQFGIKTEMFIPIPGWSQGFLFGMLNKMGLTDYTSTNVPTGDPNVLRTSVMREVDQQSVMSGFKINLETTYEQKYIRDVDPGLSFQDIISNLLRAGTSDMKFVINSGKSDAFKNFVAAVNSDAKGSVDKWLAFGKEMINDFMTAISDFFNDVKDEGNKQWSAVNNAVSKENKYSQDNQDAKDKKIQSIRSNNLLTDAQKNAQISALEKKPTVQSAAGKIFEFDNSKAAFSAANSIFSAIGSTLLAGSVYRYRWPLRGSIGVMSGLNTTPWHLTIGNPFSPILNIGNIVVDEIKLDFSNELGFNDMSKSVKATIQLKLGRDLGKQEIERMFNNQYGRVYSTKTTSSGTSGTSGENENTNNTNNTNNGTDQNPPVVDKKTPTHDAIIPKDKSGNTAGEPAKSDKTNYKQTQKQIDLKGSTAPKHGKVGNINW